MNELSRILEQARRDAEAVEDETADAFDTQLPEGEKPAVHDLPKMLFTWKEAAWVSSISVRTLQRYVREGKLRVTRIGGNTRIRRQELDQLAEDNLQ